MHPQCSQKSLPAKRLVSTSRNQSTNNTFTSARRTSPPPTARHQSCVVRTKSPAKPQTQGTPRGTSKGSLSTKALAPTTPTTVVPSDLGLRLDFSKVAPRVAPRWDPEHGYVVERPRDNNNNVVAHEDSLRVVRVTSSVSSDLLGPVVSTIGDDVEDTAERPTSDTWEYLGEDDVWRVAPHTAQLEAAYVVNPDRECLDLRDEEGALWSYDFHAFEVAYRDSHMCCAFVHSLRRWDVRSELYVTSHTKRSVPTCVPADIAQCLAQSPRRRNV